MAYGIEVENSNGRLQLSSENAEIKSTMRVIASGSAYPGHTSGASGPVSLDPSKEFLAFRRPLNNVGFIRGSHNAAGTVWTVENNSSSAYGYIEWIKIRFNHTVTSVENSGYGINIYNDSAGTLSFSSNWDEGLDIISVTDSSTVGTLQTDGGNPVGSGSGAMAGESIYNPGGLSNLSTFSPPSKIYVTGGKMIFKIPGTSPAGGRRMGTFRYRSQGIEAEGLVAVYPENGFGGYGVQIFRLRDVNSSSVLVIRRRT